MTYNVFIYYMNRTPSTKKQEKKRETDRQTDRMQSARGQIIHNVREVTDGECIRQA